MGVPTIQREPVLSWPWALGDLGVLAGMSEGRCKKKWHNVKLGEWSHRPPQIMMIYFLHPPPPISVWRVKGSS